jgi:NADH:ubiquinone oxidoreductase subunit K
VLYVNVGDRLKAGTLVIGMLVGCLALWTANPIAWLWVASQIDEGGPPSMTAIMVVVIGVVCTAVALAVLLAWLHRRYREIHGVHETVRLRMPWLSSPSGQRAGLPRELELTVLDVILISSVFLAAGLYEWWFIFHAGSSIDQRTGRH